MTEREALKMALEALEIEHSPIYGTSQTAKAIKFIKEVLAQPEQEPVAWTLLLVGEHHGIIGKAGDAFSSAPEHYRRVDVYTTPPPVAEPHKRKPLTDEEIDKAMAENKQKLFDTADNYIKMRRAYARIIEAAHGIKGEA